MINMKTLAELLHNFQQDNINCVTMLFLPTIAFILIFFYFFVLRRRNTRKNSPPSPPGLPIIGNLHQLGSLPHRSLRALSNMYGPITLVHIGSVPTIIVSSAEMAHEVMKTQDLTFASRPRMSMAKMLLYDCDMAFAPYGEYWRQTRKICVIHVLSGKMVQSFRHVREEEVSLMVSKIRSSERDFVELSELIVTLTTDIITRVAFGKKYNEREGDASKRTDMATEFAQLIGSILIGDFIPWLAWLDSLSGLNARARKNAKELDEFFEEVVDDHLRARREPGGNHKEDCDFVDILLSLYEKDDESVGISLDRNCIKALIMDMFAAGTDTSFTIIEWAMAELIRNPELMMRAQEEVRGVVGCKMNITDQDIDRMTYLKAIIKETLRLHPSLPLLIPREAVRDTMLGGFHITRGTRVMVNAWAIGRDPSSWERAEEFVPDRFLNSSVDFRGQDFQFIPFGAGRRSCPGIAFAIPTVELTLASLLHHFNWELPKGKEDEVLDMSDGLGITTPKKTGLPLVAKPWIA